LKTYKGINFKFVSKFDDLRKIKLKEKEAVFLIDDYIGSGETLVICLGEIQQNESITNDKLNIVTLAIQADTMNNFTDKGYSIYYDHTCKKGLSDFYQEPILSEKKKIMLEIEEMIPGGSHFSLGYNETESLISLARTPDNTFPVFWKTYKKGHQKFEAPFSREETFEL
jgi:hypothetical protein